MKRLTGHDAWVRISRLVACPSVAGPKDVSFIKWKHDCLRAIAQIEGEQSSILKAFDKIDYEGESFGAMADEPTYRAHFQECLAEAQAILQSIQQAVVDEMQMSSQQSASTISKNVATPTNKKVFVVHGHDEKLKTQVARFLEKLELHPIILHEQPDQGLTIIEKFEKHSDVSFAVVLLTPDDEGRKAGNDNSPRLSPIIKSRQSFPMSPRARQNVIFEFGYFIGKLGRASVCGLYQEGVELPSDYSGVLYTKVDDDGAWQSKLVKELKAAGFAVDANRLI